MTYPEYINARDRLIIRLHYAGLPDAGTRYPRIRPTKLVGSEQFKEQIVAMDEHLDSLKDRSRAHGMD